MLRKLVGNAKLRARVLERVDEFKLNKRAGESVWYRELVLCILTSNSSFFNAYKALQELGELIFTGSRNQIKETLRNAGYRFYNTKSEYIYRSRTVLGSLKRIGQLAEKDTLEAREKLLEIDGLGMKEASHFLRNVGFLDVAIIDRHVLRYLSEHVGFQGKMTSKRRYLELESLLKSISFTLGLEVGVLDLYIWYSITGKLAK
ncbi:MAG: N-glycosylase/DNA lyase [Metallosphaera yellowstonensis]|jgi:N-glycosylase/DNA lyase|uniref:8-oxoguanine DNA glycosylase/AP lyase n=1 Tax=Metallosphaera yellowstonensis MK1 TaxID=671065 RepID=H2C8B5_9CREN|nr:N-glycosylase/DNA lyase [Metallosphaera yellowstonensis]EHP68391.1 thermostable 8-oxoguanine DNA glycosylase [Metallosphaera yellowstonensis MK1]